MTESRNKRNKLGSRLISLMTALVMVFALLPFNVVTVKAEGITVSDWNGLVDALTSGIEGYIITLSSNITAPTGTNTVTVNENYKLGLSNYSIIIPSGSNVTIDGAHTITRETIGTGAFFDVQSGGTLTLTNITLDGGATATPTALTATDALVTVQEGGSLNLGTSGSTLDGATLRNNNNAGGPGGVNNSGTVTMNGGTISGNTASGIGGGVYNSGTFTMNGGTISGNTASGSGGGVFNSDTFNMSGGTISDNIATVEKGGGVYNSVHASMNISGGAVIKDNLKGGSGSQTNSNVYLSATDCDMTKAGAFTQGADIHVDLSDLTAGADMLTNGATAVVDGDQNYFTSDTADKSFVFSVDKLVLGEGVPTAAIGNCTISGETGTPLSNQTATVTLTGGTFVGTTSGVDATSWFGAGVIPDGVSVVFTATAASTTGTLTFNGTPTAISSATFGAVTIPQAQITDATAAVVAPANISAVFAITAPEPATYIDTTVSPVVLVPNSAWDADSKTLTLTGVNITEPMKDGVAFSAIKVPAGTTIDMIGLNTLKSAVIDSGVYSNGTVYSLGALTMTGSGVLDVSNSNSTGNGYAILAKGNLTVSSGYIKAYKTTIGGVSIMVSGGSFNVTGGYIDTETPSTVGVTGFATNGISINGGNVTISGGYVKTVGYGTPNSYNSGINCNNLTISGGYLEAVGKDSTNAPSNGVSCTSFTNSGGVVKATGGDGTNSYGINANTSATFNGGVTIAKSGTASVGTSAAVWCGDQSRFTESNATKVMYVNNSTVTGTSELINASRTNDGLAIGTGTTAAKDVVIAKVFSNAPITSLTNNILDGYYIAYDNSSNAPLNLDGITELTISGGNYVNNNNNGAGAVRITMSSETAIAGDGTLVCLSNSSGVGNGITLNKATGFNGNLIGIGSAGIYFYSDFTATKNVIGVGRYSYGVTSSGKLDVNLGANVIGIYTPTGGALSCNGVDVSQSSILKGNVTAIGGTEAGLNFAVFGQTLTIDKGASVTVIGSHATNGALNCSNNTLAITGGKVWAYNKDAGGSVMANTLTIGSGITAHTLASDATYGDTLTERTGTDNTISEKIAYILGQPYTVTFDTNGSSGTPPSPIRQASASAAVTIPAPSEANCGTRIGYTLDTTGWYDNADGTGTAIIGSYTPTSDITLYAKWTDNPTYTITFDANGGTVSPTSGVTFTNGTLSRLPIPTRTGYTFGGWFKESAFTTAVTTSTVFTADTTIFAKWTEGGGSPQPSGSPGGNVVITQTIPQKIEVLTNGSTVTVNMSANPAVSKDILQAAKGKDVNIVLDYGKYTWTINGKTVTSVSVSSNSYDLTVAEISHDPISVLVGADTPQVIQLSIAYSGGLPFTGVLSYPVDASYNGQTVYLYYYNSKLGGLTLSDTCVVTNGYVTFNFTHCSRYVVTTQNLGKAVGITNPFEDVTESDWFYDAVVNAYNRGLFAGVSDTTFGPKVTMTRGMFATIIARLDGADVTGYTNTKFTDVDMNAYYGKSVAWAADKGLISGYQNGKFGPNDNITREQMAAIIYNYLKYAKVSLPTTLNVPIFTDSNKVSVWANEAVTVITNSGLMQGSDNRFNPQDTASRSEVAQVLLKYLNTTAE